MNKPAGETENYKSTPSLNPTGAPLLTILLQEKVATLKAQNDKLAEELTSEQHLRYKHSLELAQQVS